MAVEQSESQTTLAGVSQRGSNGPVIVVSDLFPAVRDSCLSRREARRRLSRGKEWSLSSVTHRGAKRDFWYNERTKQTRWADKFSPPFKSISMASADSAPSRDSSDSDGKASSDPSLDRDGATIGRTAPMRKVPSRSSRHDGLNLLSFNETVARLTLDAALPLCASEGSAAFVGQDQAPATFCVHFLSFDGAVVRCVLLLFRQKTCR